MSALMRFAGGQLGSTAYDRRVAVALGKVLNAREIARRIVQPFEAMGANERSALLGGTSGVFDRAALDEWHAQSAASRVKPETTVLAPDPVDVKGRAHYELAYRGLHVVRPGDVDGTDEAAVVASFASAQGLLLDAFVEGYGGGGETFDWSLIPSVLPLPLILSGGLHAGNDAEAIRRVRPWAVDVSSGAEAAKGIKDAALITEFVAGVQTAHG